MGESTIELNSLKQESDKNHRNHDEQYDARLAESKARLQVGGVKRQGSKEHHYVDACQ